MEVMRAVLSLTWQERWNSGKKTLDTKRESLLLEINGLGLLLQQGENSRSISKYLLAMNRNIVETHDYEHELMNIHNYPATNAHKSHHQRQMDIFSALRIGIFRPMGRLEMYLAYRDEFVSHQDLGMDRDLIAYIRGGE